MVSRLLHDPETRDAALRAVSLEPDEDLRNERALALSGDLANEWLLADSLEVCEMMGLWHAERVKALIHVADRFAAAGHEEQARRIVATAEDLCVKVQPAWSRAESFLAVSRFQRKRGDDAAAMDSLAKAVSEAVAGQGLSETQAELDCASVLWEAAEELAMRKQFLEAYENAGKITQPGIRKRAEERIGAIAALGRAR